MSSLTTAVFALLLAGTPAPPAPACAAATAPCPPAEALDPATLEAARAFLRASGFETELVESARRGTMALLIAMVEQAEVEQGEPVPAERMEKIRNLMMAGVEEVVGAIDMGALDDAAAVLTRHFTAAELGELTRLSQQPVAIKFKQIGPVLATQMGSALNATNARSSAVESRIKAELDAWARESPTAPAEAED